MKLFYLMRKMLRNLIYNRPLVTKNLPGMKFMNENKSHNIILMEVVFINVLKKIRYYLDLATILISKIKN